MNNNPNIYLDWELIEKRKKCFKPLHYILLTKDLAKYNDPNFFYLQKINQRNRINDLSKQPRIMLLNKICAEIDYNLDIIKNIYKLTATYNETVNKKIKKNNGVKKKEKKNKKRDTNNIDDNIIIV